MENKSNFFVNAMALLVMVGVIGSILMISWISDSEMRVNRPTAIHYGIDGKVYIATTNDLLIATTAGERIQSIPLKEIGIGGLVTQVERLTSGKVLIAASDKNGFSWVDFLLAIFSEGDLGEPFSGGIYACSIEDKSCDKWIGASDANMDIMASAMFFAVDEDKDKIYVTNPWRQSIDIYRVNGTLLKEGLGIGSSDLLYPNGLSVMADGSLLIADTNHHRVMLVGTGVQDRGVKWSIDTQVEVGSGWGAWLPDIGLSALSVEEQDVLGYREWRWRPVSVAAGDKGFWWVVNCNASGQKSDLMLFHESKGLVKTVQFNGVADPIAIERLPGNVFLTGIQSTPAVMVIDIEGNVESGFGDAWIYSYFSKAKVNIDHLEELIWKAYLLLGCSIMLLFYVLRLDKKRRSFQ